MKDFTTSISFITGKKKLTPDMVLSNEATLIGFDLLPKFPGEAPSLDIHNHNCYAVFEFEEYPGYYLPAGNYCTAVCKKWCDGSTVREMSDALREHGGVKVKLLRSNFGVAVLF